MGKFSLYKIVLKSLSLGKHNFNYELNNKFFELIDDGTADIKRGKVNIDVVVTASENIFEFSFSTNGTVYVPCDRCLDDITIEVATNNKLIVKFGADYSEESDEIVVIPEDEGEINIAWFLYEFIVLSLPMKKVHGPGQCNRIMSTKLNKHKVSAGDSDGDNSNNEESEDDDSDGAPMDSRWDTLKEINVDEE